MVCTANICRSPMVSALLRERLPAAGVDAHVTSAGLLQEGYPAAPPVVELLARRGLDLREHRARRLAPGLVETDLVLCMERRHVRAVAVMVPEALPRTFTLKELVRRGRAVGPRRPDEPLSAWLARAQAGRRPSDLLGASDDDDLADPIGQPAAAFRRTLEEVDELVAELVGLLAGLPVGTPPRR